MVTRRLLQHFPASHVAIMLLAIVSLAFLLGPSASRPETVETKIVYVPGRLMTNQDGFEYAIQAHTLATDLQKAIDSLNAEGYSVISTTSVIESSGSWGNLSALGFGFTRGVLVIAERPKREG